MPRETRYQRMFTASPSAEVPVVTAADWRRWNDEMDVQTWPLLQGLASPRIRETARVHGNVLVEGNGNGKWEFGEWNRGLSATSVQDVFIARGFLRKKEAS